MDCSFVFRFSPAYLAVHRERMSLRQALPRR